MIAPVGLGPEGAYNVNADSAAAALAVGLGAGHLFFLTDVDGLLKGGEAVTALGPELCRYPPNREPTPHVPFALLRPDER